MNLEGVHQAHWKLSGFLAFIQDVWVVASNKVLPKKWNVFRNEHVQCVVKKQVSCFDFQKLAWV